MRTDHDWLEDGCLECGTVHFRKSPLLGVCVDCFRAEMRHHTLRSDILPSAQPESVFIDG